MPARRVVVTVAILCVVLVGWDLSRPPARQTTARIMLAAIDLYQATLSPLLGRAGASCRFEPSCSHYGEAVIRKHGALRGSWLAMTRIARCGPWTPMGTEDPPPRG